MALCPSGPVAGQGFFDRWQGYTRAMSLKGSEIFISQPFAGSGGFKAINNQIGFAIKLYYMSENTGREL